MMKDMSRLVQLYRKQTFYLLCGVFLAVTSSLSSIVLVSTSGWFITAMGIAGVAGVSINYFTPAAVIRACAIVRTGGKYLERLITHDATLRLLQSLRVELYRRLVGHSPLKIQGLFRSGDLLARLKGDIDTLDQFYLSFLVPLLVALSNIALSCGLLFFYSEMLAFVVGGMMSISLIVVPLLCLKVAGGHEEQLVHLMGETRADMVSRLQGFREIQVLDHINANERNWLKSLAFIHSHQWHIDRVLAVAQLAISLCANLSLLLVLTVLLPLFSQEEIKLAALVMLVLMTWVSFDELGKMPFAVQSLPRARRALHRVYAFEEVPAGAQGKTKIDRLEGKEFSVSFENVSFSYGDTASVLRNVSFNIQRGEKLAIVGPTGAGKTTILHLLLGFCQPTSGRICLCGIDIGDLAADAVLSQFSVVQQHPYIFDRTLADNLKIAKPDASLSQIQSVCQVAGLADFINHLPDGYATYMGEHGLNLSGGELKRLALARALLKDAPCLVLDEVGEGLDEGMEQDIMERVIQSFPEKSLIVITHRSAIAKKMERILPLSSVAG